MKKDKQVQSSILAMLVRNYASLTLFILLVIAGVLGYYHHRINQINVYPEPEVIKEFVPLMEQGRYSSIPAETILGRKGFFEILDENCEFLYSSNKDYLIEFTVNEVNYIESARNQVKVVVAPCVDTGDELTYVVTRTFYTRNGDIEHCEYLVLDEDYRVLDGIWRGNRERLTPREFDVLCQRILNHYTVTKYTFENKKSGSIYTMLLFSYVATEEEIEHEYNLLYYVIMIFALAYFAIAGCNIWWTYRNVDQPLKILDEVINHYEMGGIPEVEYQGHKEFVKLFDSFSEMAYRLTKSEQTRQQLEKERSQMVANISHDLKTPITVIAGYSKAICDNLIPDSEKQMYFESIYQKSSHLAELINTFAEYSKLEHPEFQLNLKTMDLSEVLRQYLAELYGELEIEGFSLEADIPERPVYCELDEFSFMRILENILENSIRYNAAGTCIFAQLQVDDQNRRAVLSLGDNGRGIPEKYREHIFDPFVVGDDARGSGQGSGLGLAVVKKLVVEHGGCVELNAHPPKGISTQFVIRLPMTDENLTKS